MGEVQNYIADAASKYSNDRRNGQIIFRRKDHCGHGVQSQERGMEIIVKNIPSDCNAEELLCLFLQAGVIVEMRIMVDHDSHCKGIAFIKYEKSFQCRLAITIFNGHKSLGRKELVVEESKEFHELIFSGIPVSVSMKCVENLFKSKYWNVGKVREESNCGAFMKVRVEFASHRAAALVRREFSCKKQVLWNSHITAEWPETAKNHLRTTATAAKSNLDLSKWEDIDESALTKDYWENYFTALWDDHQRMSEYALRKNDRNGKNFHQKE